MSRQDNTTIQVLRSADVLSGGTTDISSHFSGGLYPKLPDADILEYGEIALNIAKGYEVIAIKNYDGEVVYLPFNVATRLLNTENGLEELRNYSIQSVDELSATTVSLYDDIESFKADIRNAIESELTSFSGSVYSSIEQLSGETDTKINSLSLDLESQIRSVEELLQVVSDSIISNLSGKIEDVSVETLSLISSLSAETLSQIDEVRQSISGYTESEINSLSAYTVSGIESVNNRIDDLSGNTNTGIAELRGELIDFVGEADGALMSTIESLSGSVEDSISDVVDLIESVSADTDTRIGDLETRVNDEIEVQIDSLSADTDSKLNELWNSLSDEIGNKIESLSASTDTKIIEVEGRINEEVASQVQGLSASTDTKLNSLEVRLNEDISGQIESLSASTDTKINKSVGEAVNAVLEDVGEVSDKVDSLSAVTESEIGMVYDELSDSINVISAVTDYNISQLSDEFNVKVIELSASTVSSLNELSSKVDAISASTSGVTSAVTEYVNSVVGGVEEELFELSGNMMTFSGETVSAINELSDDIGNIEDNITSISGAVESLGESVLESLSAVTENIDGKIVSAKNDAISISNQYTNERIDSLSGSITTYVDGEVSDLKGEIDNKISSTSAVTKTEAVEESITYIDCRIQEVSGVAESYINEKIDEAKQEVIDASEYMIGVATQGIEDNAVRRSGEYTDIVANGLSYKIDSVSGETANSLSELEGEIGEISERVDDIKLSDLQDVNIVDRPGDADLQFLTRSGDTWSNTSVGLASKDEYGFVKIGDGINVESGVISAQALDVDDTIISGSTNPIAGGAVYPLKEQIVEVSGSTEEIRSELDGHITSFNVYSAETESKINEISGSVTTYDDRLIEIELVHAGAFAGLRRATGIDENEHYNPTFGPIQGMNMTEAIDFVGETAYNFDNEIERVEGDIVDVEMVHAGAFSRINHSLGFDNNAEYNPSQYELSGMTVSEAIDYLYQWTDEIDHYLGTVDTKQLIRSVTYETLSELKKQKKLRWGLLYRITNYQATVNESMYNVARPRIDNVQSGPHTSMGFDIIVRATSNMTLDENAMLTMSENKYYFEDCCVESWNVKYCLENDKSRFEWCDENGYGVIYYMKDNYANEAYYDFKNIVFMDGSIKKFTFNDSSNNTDLSMFGKARGNEIKASYIEMQQINKAVQVLNRNVFNGSMVIGNTTDVGLVNCMFSGNFYGCHVSMQLSDNNVNGPKTNEFIGYVNT